MWSVYVNWWYLTNQQCTLQMYLCFGGEYRWFPTTMKVEGMQQAPNYEASSPHLKQ